MMFPIKFDVEAGVTEAIKDWKDQSKRLEKAIDKKSFKVKIGVDVRGLKDVKDVQKALSGLKIEPADPKTQTAIRLLTNELNALARAMQKVSSLKGITLPELQRAQADKLNKDVALADEKLALAKKRTRQAQERLTLAQRKAEIQAISTGKAYGSASSYLHRLTQRMIAYASISYVSNFLTQIREVTAEFELQRVSLGAILQNQQQANQLFSEIKQFALKSPVKILDLTKYTKQLAAYKIGYDELFDTMKRLTDVSVGLGVSMDRIVLLYGQVRATGYLRASEVRQATEAGIPLVEELAKKYTQLNGRLVTAADVMEMISKRQVAFEDVKDVFNDMTNAGGIFYNMQEKQGNTLYGMWQKLGDAASVMYEQIGNTGFINDGMKSAIKLLTQLMRNWQQLAAVALAAGAAFASKSFATSLFKRGDEAFHKKTSRAIENRIAAQTKLDIALKSGTHSEIKAAKAALKNAYAQETAAKKAEQSAGTLQKMGRGLVSFGKSLLLTGAWGVAIAGLSLLTSKIIGVKSNIEKLQAKLSQVMGETRDLIEHDKQKLIDLAERVAGEGVIEGSKDQKEALEELNRTYGNIIPAEELSIENLKRLRSGANNAADAYKTLTNAVANYNVEMAKQKIDNEADTLFGADIADWQSKLIDNFTDLDLGAGKKYGVEHAARFFAKIKELAKIPMADLKKSLGVSGYDDNSIVVREKIIREAVKFALNQQGGSYVEALTQSILNDRGSGRKETWIEKILRDEKAIADFKRGSEAALNELGVESDKFIKAMQRLDEKLKGEVNVNGTTGLADKDFLNQQAIINTRIKQMADFIQNDPDIKSAFEKAGVAINEEWFSIVEKVVRTNPMKVSSIDFSGIFDSLKDVSSPELKSAIAEIQKKYNELAPTDATVSAMRQQFVKIAYQVDSTGATMNGLRTYLMQAGESWENYSKRVRSAIDEYKLKIKEMERVNIDIANGTDFLSQGYTAEQIEQAKQMVMVLEMMLPSLAPSKSSATKQDPRLQNLKEEISLVQKLYQEYQQLEKQEGASKAASDMERMAKSSIDMLSKKYGIALPTTAKDLTSALEILYKKMEALPKKVFPALDRELNELRWTIEKVNIDDSQKNIEKSLKELSDRIARTKTAREFYDKILSQTGDFNLAKRISENIFDSFGAEANDRIFEYISEMVKATSAKLDLNIFNKDMSFDPQRLRKWADANKDALGEDGKAYKELIKLAEDADKDFAKTIEGWIKATKKAETFGGKLTDIYRTTAAEIEKIQTAINNGRLDPSFGKELIEGYRRKEAEEVAKLQYEAFKDSPMYVQMFDDLDNASSRMLRNMKARLEDMRDNWKNLDPTQLKELQSRLKEIDEQLAKRNPFKAFTKGLKDLYDLRKNGDSRGNKSRKDADNEVIAWTDAYLKAQQQLAKVTSDPKSTDAQIAGARQMVDYTKQQKDEAEKAAENWKKVEDAIGLSANELSQRSGWASDIMHGIADISEALGADQEDVQYWNDMADAMEQITSGIQDIVQSAMNGNVMGIISSAITAIPKMFIGFTNIFSAGKIRKANKEIKKQQELLDELAYSYSRLEAAAEKAFGSAYVNNYRQQLKNLQAQASAYQKQAEAERSKGKKKDKDKIKEYENAYRDTMDEIAEMQSQISAQMLGSDITSAARDFAKAWLDAYKEIGSAGAKTTDALKEKFSDMVENMVVEGALAAVMERALRPMFDMIDNMSEQDFYSRDFWSRVVAKAEQGAKDADYGAQTMMSFLEQAGINIREINDEYTGIKRDIASASEETMNNVAAIGNTLMYYVSPIPTISENVAIMRQLMENGGSGIATASSPVDSTALWNRHLELQQGIYTHTLRNAELCEQMARRCADIADDLHKVIVPRGKKGSFQVYVGGM